MAVKAVVLGAGEGTRMAAILPKVIHRVAGRPMIRWVLDAVAQLEPAQTVVVVKPDADQVVATLPDYAEPVVQARQLGTAHALGVALGVVSTNPGDHVLVVPADTPLITYENPRSNGQPAPAYGRGGYLRNRQHGRSDRVRTGGTGRVGPGAADRGACGHHLQGT